MAELMNEPWSGDAVTDPLLMMPGVADKVSGDLLVLRLYVCVADKVSVHTSVLLVCLLQRTK